MLDEEEEDDAAQGGELLLVTDVTVAVPGETPKEGAVAVLTMTKKFLQPLGRARLHCATVSIDCSIGTLAVLATGAATGLT